MSTRLEVRFDSGRSVVTLRPSGVGRFFGAALLGVWLCGWALGEAFGMAFLISSLLAIVAPGTLERLGASGSYTHAAASAMALLFMVVWLGFWTLGGVLASREFLRSLWAADRIEWDGAGIDLDARIGPWRRRRHLARAELRGVRLERRTQALVALTAATAVQLTQLGTQEQRNELRLRLRDALGLDDQAARAPATLPEGWESDFANDGTPVVRRSATLRRSWARFMGWTTGILGAVCALTVIQLPSGGPGVAVAAAIVASLGLGSALLALWFACGVSEIGLGRGWAEIRRGWPGRVHVERLEPLRIRLRHHVDSDGDDHYTLQLTGDGGKHSVASTMNEPEPVLRLGRWMAERAGVALDLPYHLHAAA
jgi:hypothetical protein